MGGREDRGGKAVIRAWRGRPARRHSHQVMHHPGPPAGVPGLGFSRPRLRQAGPRGFCGLCSAAASGQGRAGHRAAEVAHRIDAVMYVQCAWCSRGAGPDAATDHSGKLKARDISTTGPRVATVGRRCRAAFHFAECSDGDATAALSSLICPPRRHYLRRCDGREKQLKSLHVQSQPHWTAGHDSRMMRGSADGEGNGPGHGSTGKSVKQSCWPLRLDFRVTPRTGSVKAPLFPARQGLADCQLVIPSKARNIYQGSERHYEKKRVSVKNSASPAHTGPSLERGEGLAGLGGQDMSASPEASWQGRREKPGKAS